MRLVFSMTEQRACMQREVGGVHGPTHRASFLSLVSGVHHDPPRCKFHRLFLVIDAVLIFADTDHAVGQVAAPAP